MPVDDVSANPLPSDAWPRVHIGGGPAGNFRATASGKRSVGERWEESVAVAIGKPSPSAPAWRLRDQRESTPGPARAVERQEVRPRAKGRAATFAGNPFGAPGVPRVPSPPRRASAPVLRHRTAISAGPRNVLRHARKA